MGLGLGLGLGLELGIRVRASCCACARSSSPAVAEAAVAEVSAAGGGGAAAPAALPVGSDPPEDESCMPPDSCARASMVWHCTAVGVTQKTWRVRVRVHLHRSTPLPAPALPAHNREPYDTPLSSTVTAALLPSRRSSCIGWAGATASPDPLAGARATLSRSPSAWRRPTLRPAHPSTALCVGHRQLLLVLTGT